MRHIALIQYGIDLSRQARDLQGVLNRKAVRAVLWVPGCPQALNLHFRLLGP
jgi:hypothetical protein